MIVILYSKSEDYNPFKITRLKRKKKCCLTYNNVKGIKEHVHVYLNVKNETQESNHTIN